MSTNLAVAAYKECCDRHKVKPNAEILRQITVSVHRMIALRELDSRKTFLGAAGVRALLDFVALHQRIERLYLGNNGVDASCVGKLVDVTVPHKSLCFINLEGNKFSTPTARQLWECSKASHLLQELNIDGCGVAAEWENRIQRHVGKNAELQVEGFHPEGIPRAPCDWSTAFICVMVGPGMQVYADLFNAQVIPPLNTLLAQYRVRVAMMLVDEGNADGAAASSQNSEAAARKDREIVNLCCDAYNYRLPWMVAFVSETLTPRMEGLLRQGVASIPALPTSIHDRLGNKNDAVYRCATNVFIYAEHRSTYDSIDWTDEERNTEAFFGQLVNGEHIQGSGGAADAGTGAPRPQLTPFRLPVDQQINLAAPDPALVVRLQTDIFTALQTAYYTSQPVRFSSQETNEATMQRIWLFCERHELEGREHQREVRNLIQYVTKTTATGSACPLAMYGGPGIGRSYVLGALCMALRRASLGEEDPHSRQPSPNLDEQQGSPLVVAKESRSFMAGCKVVPYFLSEVDSASLVTFLYFLLRAFRLPAQEQHPKPFDSVECLMDQVREAITSYPESEPFITVVVAGAEQLDNAGRRGDPPLLWLPHVMPSNVRIVLGIATDSHILPMMRGRQPQPYEELVTPLSSVKLMQRVLTQFEKQGLPQIQGFDPVHVLVPAYYHQDEGLNTLGARPTQAARRLLLKEEADLSVYAQLVGALFRLEDVHLLPDEPTVLEYVDKTVPETCGGVATRILALLEAQAATDLDRQILQLVLHCVTTSPMSIPDLVAILEESTQIGVPAFATLPVLVALRNAKLVYFTNDGSVRCLHAKVRHSLMETFNEEELEQTRAAITHVRDHQVLSRSAHMYTSFTHLPNLLLVNCQEDVLAQRLLDVGLLDDLMKGDGMRPLLIDAAFRYLHHVDQLAEIGLSGDKAQFQHNGSVARLKRSLLVLQLAPPNLFQASLLLPDDAALYESALRVTQGAVEGKAQPYPALRQINKYAAERYSVWTNNQLPLPLTHCTVNPNKEDGEFVVTSRSGQISVLSKLDGTVVASTRLSGGEALGALCAGNGKIIGVAPSRLTLWDPRHGETTEMEGYTCSIHPASAFAASNHSLLAAVEVAENRAVVIDTNTAKVVSILSAKADVIREARFVGDSVLVVSLYDLYLYTSKGEEHTLSHPGFVRAVSSTQDGKLLAVVSGATMFVWSTAYGQCEHVCEGHKLPINDCCFTPNGSLVATSGTDGNILLWSSLSGQLYHTLETRMGNSDFCSVTPDGSKIVARCGSNLRMWDGITFEDLGAINAHNEAVKFIGISDSFSVSISEREVKLWSLYKLFPTVQQSQLRMPTNSITYSPCVEKAQSLGGVKFLTPNPSRSLLLTILASSPPSAMTGQRNVMCNKGGRLQLWNVLQSTGGRFGEMQEEESKCVLQMERIDAAQFLDNDSFVFVRDHTLCKASVDGTILEQKPLLAEVSPDGDICLQLRPAAGLVAVGCGFPDGVRVMVYHLSNFAIRAQIAGHTGRVVGMYFIADSIITASTDRTVKVWSAASNAERFSYSHPSSIVVFKPLPWAPGDYFLHDGRGENHIVSLGAGGLTLKASLPSVGTLVDATPTQDGSKMLVATLEGQGGKAEAGATLAVLSLEDHVVSYITDCGGVKADSSALVVNKVGLPPLHLPSLFPLRGYGVQCMAYASCNTAKRVGAKDAVPWVCMGTLDGCIHIFEFLAVKQTREGQD